MKRATFDLGLRQCDIRIVLVQLYTEPANDFNMLFVQCFSALSL